MTRNSLPGSIWTRLKYGLLLTGALLSRAIAVVGLRSLDYAFKRRNSQQELRHLSRPLRFLVSLGYWMLGGVTTGNWNEPSQSTRPTSELP
jgi:hypothetical protein